MRAQTRAQQQQQHRAPAGRLDLYEFSVVAQVHTVLGVLYNLSYQYDHAAEAFARALEVALCVRC
jgi:hypothetical protein